jgi:hypothetical protein
VKSNVTTKELLFRKLIISFWMNIYFSLERDVSMSTAVDVPG